MKSKLFFSATIILAVALMAACTKTGPQGPQGPLGPTGPQGPQGVSSSPVTDVMVDSITAIQWNDSVGHYYYYTFTAVGILFVPDSEIVSMTVSQTYSPTNPAYATWSNLPVFNYLHTGDAFSFSFGLYKAEIMYTYTSAPTNTELYFKLTVIQPLAIKKKIGVVPGALNN